MNKAVVVIIGMVTVATVAGFVYVAKPKTPPRDFTNLTKCLAEKKVTMYGAYWCPHCQREKKAFGEAFQYVPYVECTQETQKCIDMRIEGYPTWIFENGTRLSGEQGPDKLAAESGCSI